jgi:dihydrofolate synthase/folylpolyglutamate synthase
LQTIEYLTHCKNLQSQDDIKIGLLNVVKIRDFKEDGNKWVIPKNNCDTAHNKHGLEIVLNQIKFKEKFEQLHIVLGVVNDKDLDEILFSKMLFIIFQNK